MKCNQRSEAAIVHVVMFMYDVAMYYTAHSYHALAILREWN
jgi:hypothetical protein